MLAAVNVGDSVQKSLDSFFNFLPNVLGFLIILLVGWLIAKVVGKLVTKALEAAGLDRSLRSSSAGEYVARVSPDASPSRLIGAIVFWFIFLFALSAGIAALKIPALTDFIRQVEGYLPNIVAAVLIFVLAAALAGAAAGGIGRLMGDTPTGRMLQAVLPGIILAIGAFMVLDQLNIAPQIVTITYAGLVTLLVIAGGLAFGLGGRDVAAEMLRDAYDRGRANEDFAVARAKMRREGRFARTDAEDAAGSTAPTTTARSTAHPSPSEHPDHPTG
jgi:Conserved TM helix